MAEFEDQIVAEYPYIERFATRLTGNREAGQDLTQDTMERALRSESSYRQEGKMHSWLSQITMRLFLDKLKRDKIVPMKPLIPANLANTFLPSAENEAMKTLDVEEAIQAVNNLPEPFKTAITLTGIHQMNHQTVGDLMGTPRVTVSTRVHRGRAILRQELRKAA